MSAIIMALVLFTSVNGIPFTFILLNKKHGNKKYKGVLRRVSEEGSKYGLSFSSKVLLKNKIIAFDGARQTLLILEFEKANSVTCINMADVKSCVLNKTYNRINMGDARKVKMEDHLKSIELTFKLRNEPGPIVVSFYESSVNSIYEMAALEAKAKDWRTVLSKMIFEQLKVSA